MSVVIPVFNAEQDLGLTIDAVVAAIQRAGVDAELVVIDDGSTDESAAVARRVTAGRLPLTLIRQPNRGRFEARRAGLDAATRDWILLLDSRLTLEPGSLRFVAERVADGKPVWTGHVEIPSDRNAYATFWKLIAELAWDEYFSHPRTTSFGLRDFDRYPKGTGCFFAPRTLLVGAFGAFRTGYADLRDANDDTPLLRWIAERESINISPEFRGSYVARASLPAFVRHAFHRGVVFLDGHGRRESRFAPVVFAFYPASILLVLAALRRPVVVPLATAAVTGAAAGALGLAKHRSRYEIRSLALLAPVYTAAHGAGMWSGLAKLVRKRFAA